MIQEKEKLGIEGYGIKLGEFDEESAKKNGIRITKTFLKRAKYPSESFDIIT